jgi:hypothetical protein
MRIRAIASATERSNAVGVVEVDCTPHGLVLGFLGVGSFSEGYAPGALASGVQLTVPWSALKEARAEGDQVFVALDWPGLPHDQLTLTRFSLGNALHPLELRRQRLILHVAALSAAVLASIVSAAVVPQLSHRATAALTLSVGAAAALLVLAVGFLLDQRLLGSPVREATIRSAFVSELGRYFPALVQSGVAPARVTPRRLPDLTGFLPRTAAAIAITLAAGIVTALGTARHLLRPQETVATVQPTTAPAGPTDAALSPVPAEGPADDSPAPTEPAPPSVAPPASPDGLQVVQRCACNRASSPLWEEPIPTLSMLVLESSQRVRRDRVRTQLEVAVVNNGMEPLQEITVHVRFFEGEGKEQRQTAERPLYFEGPLAPGRAIKWRTEAKGTHFEVDPPFFGHLDPSGSNAAPSATFGELLKAKHRPVRLHAARMLAFLGDPSAAQATLQLKDALRSAEGPYLRRLMAALADIRVCDVRFHEDGPRKRVEACIYNATDQDRDQLGLQLVALDRALSPDRPVDTPPVLLGDRRWPLPTALPAHSGVLVSTSLDVANLGGADARAFELHADRFDLLE